MLLQPDFHHAPISSARTRPWWRSSFAGPNVIGSQFGVFGRSNLVGLDGDSPFCFFKISLQIRHTPTAPRSRTAALADLTGAARLVNPNEVENLSLRNVKAVTDRIVDLQKRVLFRKEIKECRSELIVSNLSSERRPTQHDRPESHTNALKTWSALAFSTGRR